MKRAAACIAFVSLGVSTLWGSAAWAQDVSEQPDPAPEEPAEASKAAEAVTQSGEIVLDNAAMAKVLGEAEPSSREMRPKPHRFGVYVGLRMMHLPDRGYDPYSDSDALVQNAIGVSFSPWKSQPLSLHFVGEWNLGASEASARGASTKLLVNRFALGLEGRWMPASRFYLYAKVVPGVVRLDGEIDDYELAAHLESTASAFVLDASAGGALRLGTAGTSSKRTASFWLMMDWGYSFARQTSMVFQPIDEDDETRRFGTVTLPSIRPGGFVTRMSVAVTF